MRRPEEDARRIERGRQAAAALELLEPAFEAVASGYGARMREIVAREPWEIEKLKALVMAQRIVEEVRGQIRVVVLDGESARRDVQRIEKIASMSEARRRVLGV